MYRNSKDAKPRALPSLSQQKSRKNGDFARWFAQKPGTSF